MKRTCSDHDLSPGSEGSSPRQWTEEELLGPAPASPSLLENSGVMEVDPQPVVKVPYTLPDESIRPPRHYCLVREGRDPEVAGDHLPHNPDPIIEHPVSRPISPLTSNHQTLDSPPSYLEQEGEELYQALDELENCDPPAAESEKPAKEERSAKHPWAQFYAGGPGIHTGLYSPQDTPGEYQTDALIRLLARHYTLADAMKFREMARDQADQPPKEDRTITKQPLDFIAGFPEGSCAPYQIIERRGKSLIAASLFTEIYAPDRPDLRLARVTFASRLLNSTKTDAVVINTTLLLPGDVLLVTKLASNPKRTKTPSEYTMADVGGTSDAPAYTIAEFQLLPRRTLTDVFIHPINTSNKIINCLVEGSRSLASVPRATFPEDSISKKPYMGTAFLPYDHPSALLDKASNHYILCSEIREITPLPHPASTVYEIRSAGQEVEEEFTGALQHHRHSNNNKTLYRMAAFAAEAVLALANADLDRRTYTATTRQIIAPADGTKTVMLEVTFGHHPPPQKAWGSAKSGVLRHHDLTLPVTIVGATFTEPRSMLLRVKIGRLYAASLPPANTEGLQVLIYQTPDDSFRPILHALTHPPPTGNSRGETILKAVFGGRSISRQPVTGKYPIPANVLSADQRAFADCLLHTKTLAMIGEGCFGGGKSTTVVITANHLRHKDSIVLITATTNAATTNICAIAKAKEVPSVVRLITAANHNNLETTLHTDADIPTLMAKLIREILREEHPLSKQANHQRLPEFVSLLSFGIRTGLVTADDINRCPPSIRRQLRHGKRAQFMVAALAFLKIAEPQILVATIDSALSFFATTLAVATDKVTTVIVDEASQVPVTTFIAITGAFPSARVALVGDRRQLPPLKPEGTPKFVSQLGCTSILDAIDKEQAVPVYPFWDSFRCPEDITATLSGLFYKGSLRSKKAEDLQRLQLPPSIWSPQPHRSSIRFMEPGGVHQQAGTSLTNAKEIEFIMAALKEVEKLNTTPTVAVLTFYRAQLLAITTEVEQAPLKITPFLGTVDGSQGREFDLVFVATTRTSGSDTSYVADAKRINVAVSRTKDKCIVTGSIAFLRQSKPWRQLIDASEQRSK